MIQTRRLGLKSLCVLLFTAALISCGGNDDVSSSGSGGSSSGVQTNPQSLRLEEDDKAVCVLEGIIESQHQGFSGSGYANTDNRSGAGLVLHVNVEAAVRGRVTIDYANGSNATRVAALTVNGVASSELGFVGNEDWTDWQSLEVPLDLYKGANRIDVSALSEAGLPNIDAITITADAIHGGNCALPDVSVSPSTAVIEQDISFSATLPWADESLIASYRWQFGDGQQSPGVSAIHQFSQPGLYQVSLVTVDLDGYEYRISTSLEVLQTVTAPTVFIAGDSTVSNYTDTPSTTDQAGWGQMLHEQFSSAVTVDNRAIGGRTARRFIDEGRLDEIWGAARAGDYLLVQFGTNDGHRTATYSINGVSVPYYLDPATDFKEYLMVYVDGARARGLNLIFVTPPPRNSAYCTGGNGTGAHAQAMRELAISTDTPLADLNDRVVRYLTAICPSPVPENFFLLRSDGSVDGTHFQENGARIMSRFVAEEIQSANVPLAIFVGN